MCVKKIFIMLIGSLFVVMPVQAELADPTRPPNMKSMAKGVTKKQNRPRWVLSSTLVSTSRRSAVINDKVVVVGDRVNGARVVSIRPSSVRLQVNGRDITLVMLKKDVKSVSRVAAAGRKE